MDLGKAAGSVLPRNCISATIFPPTCRKARIATTAADGSQDDCGSRSPWERQVFHLPGHQLRSRIFQRGRPCCRTERGLLHRRTSFAIETTLRSAVTFEQARSAAAAGFITEMRYVVLRDFAMYLERVKIRADAGGHSASETTLRRIYGLSLANLRRAVTEMDDLWAYDNTKVGGPPKLLMETEKGVIRFLVEDPPDWLANVFDQY
jgi:predicted ABC-type ATPase